MRSEITDFLITLVIFVITLAISPLLVLSYLTVKITHTSWYNIVSYLYPQVEFIKGPTLRTLTDTHRNQGVITVLLTLRGPADVESVRRHLQNVVARTDKLGNPFFPRLKDILVTRCGMYAWQKGPEHFEVDQNLIVAPFTFRGRIVSDYNIQDCVSEMVSKYLPNGISPWQVQIIPSSDQQHYILLRLHHVLLTEKLTIADLLPLKNCVKHNSSTKPYSPLRGVFQRLEHTPQLLERLAEDFTNAWNEFIANYDPLEKTELLKSTPGYFEFLAILLITSVSVWKEYRKGIAIVKKDFTSRLRYFLNIAKKESSKRKVDVRTFLLSILVTLHPRNLAAFVVKYVWLGLLSSILRLPQKIYNELRALYTCFKLQYCAYPNTAIGLIYNYAPLLFYSAKEAWYCTKVLFRAPRNILDEIFSYQDIVQTVTLCGRKVVAWSTPVRTEYITSIAKQVGVSETEVILSVCSSGIAQYFEKIHDVPPREIAITARNVDSTYIFCRELAPKNTIGGMLCIGLPIIDMKKDVSPLENLQKINMNVASALEKQPLTYFVSVLQTRHGILSKLLPATFIELFLRGLSVKYSVLFTEVTTKNPEVVQETVWGAEIVSAVYWRPPQANISISLCVNQYADHTVLGVMSDAQLAPNHRFLVKNFPDYLADLAVAAGIQ